MQGNQPNESAPYGPSSSSSTPAPLRQHHSTTTPAATTPKFSSTSSSSSGIPFTHHQHQYQGLHRRRGSAASDHSSSASPSSPNHPSLSSSLRHLSSAATGVGVGPGPGGVHSIDVSTFNPDNLSRPQHQHQHQQRHQAVSNNDASLAMHPNITHHNSNNKNKHSSPFFQETVTATAASIGYNNNLQPNHLQDLGQEQWQRQGQGYPYHPHIVTADSLASLGGGGGDGPSGVGEGVSSGNGDNDDAEFEVRVITNRTDVGKDNDNTNKLHVHYKQRQQLDDNYAASGHVLTTTDTGQQLLNGQPRHQQETVVPATGKQKRLQSLDILRGITIIFMVLVNTQGADPFEQLAHTPWFGYTLADWVFPNFIFMVGMAIAIVLSPTKVVALSREESSSSSSIWKRHEARIRMSLKTVKRSIILFAIGLSLNALEMIGTPTGGWIRIPGVLQRIGICYFILALSVLWSPVQTLSSSSGSVNNSANKHTSNKMNRAHTTLSVISRSSLISMPVPKILTSSRRIQIGLPIICTTLWFILTYTIQSSATEPISSCLYPPQAISYDSNNTIVVLPGFAPSRGQLSPAWCTAQSVVDTWLFTKDRDPNNPIFDAEGSLGTLMAIVTGWFGWMIGGAVVEQQRQQKVLMKRVVDAYEEEMKEEEEMEEEDRVRGRRRVLGMQDESPKDTSESSSFAAEQQHHQQHYSTASTTYPPQAMETIQPPPSSPTTTTSDLQTRLAVQQRTFLLANLGNWFMAGTSTMFAGTILGWFLPICKGLWSPSFTLYSAGISINSLCILMYIYDVPSLSSSTSESSITSAMTTSPTLPTKQPTHRSNLLPKAPLLLLHTLLNKTSHFLTRLLTAYGRNPTLIYILSELCKIVLEKIPAHGGFPWVQTVWSFLFFNSFYTFMPPAWASLVFSLVYILVFAPILWVLDQRGLYLRV